MGYFEPWDSVWPCENKEFLGWYCPRCEIFVQRDEEHECEKDED